ncbi:hypothetical protein EPH_0006160 [Eimeria praecox]|uniref:Uncharacterized protein n=1 Tax=Eimeria praecox TaxID=51316 RepID=U6GAY6_9EIME|nr:hypothetical protein EPH_0006160 [Eimeria praecox]
MLVREAAQVAAPPTSLSGKSDSAWEVSLGDVVFPVTSRSIQRRRNEGTGGLSMSVVALAAFAAVAAAYLVLRCGLYLANANERRATLRHLAGAEGRMNKGVGEICGDPVENPSAAADAAAEEEAEEEALVEGDLLKPCGDPEENPPAAADAAAEEEAEEEALVEGDLLKRARRYAVELRRLIDSSEPLVRQLNPQLKAKCISAFLCLSLVELSASFSVLEGKERAEMQREVTPIYRRIWSLRDSLGSVGISQAQHRHIKCLHLFLPRLAEVEPTTAALAERQRLQILWHIKCLHLFLPRLAEVEPATAALAERQRLQILKHLLQLQEVALGQLNVGLFWLRVSLGSSKKASDDAGDVAAAAAAVEGASSAAKGAASTPEGAAAAADARVAAVVEAIAETVHRRRAHVLLDPLLSAWLRKVHTENPRYFVLGRGRFDQITQKSSKTHRQLLQSLQTTPLGWGDEPWNHFRLEAAGTKQRPVASSVTEAPSPEAKDPSKPLANSYNPYRPLRWDGETNPGITFASRLPVQSRGLSLLLSPRRPPQKTEKTNCLVPRAQAVLLEL